MVQVGPDPPAAHPLHQVEGERPVFTHVGNKNLILVRFRDFDALGVQQHQNPFQPHAESDGRDVLFPDLGHQVVVPSAAADRQLAVLCFRHKFEHGLRVVIQAADDPAVHPVRDPRQGQALLQLSEVIPALVAQQIQHTGRVLCQLLALFLLAVQHPQRVPLKAVAAAFAHFADPAAEEFLQPAVVHGTALGAADAVDLHAQVFHAEIRQQVVRQQDQLRVRRRLLRAEAFQPELVVFAQAEIANNARQMASMNQNFALQSALQECCCENRAGIADLKYTVATENCADRTQSMQNTRDIIENASRNTQAILDKLCALELDGVKNQLAQAQRENNGLQNQLNMATLRESQTAQNAFIQNGFAQEVDALYNRLNNCPVPTTPVYGRTPIFTCNSNNGCGCGCGNGF